MDRKTTLEIHLQPGAKRSEIVGFSGGVLYVKVTALPQKGQANKALVELMAETLRLPKSAFAIVRGLTGRNKIVAVLGLTGQELKDMLERELSCKDFLHLSKG